MKRRHPAYPTSARPTLQECQETEFVRTNIKNQKEYHISHKLKCALNISTTIFAVALHPKSGICSLSDEVYRPHRHTYPVGLSWMSDQLVAETATNTIQQTQEINFHAFSEIQTRDPSNRAAADPCLAPCGQTLQLDENCALLG